MTEPRYGTEADRGERTADQVREPRTLVQRLRGKYPRGPIGADGEPEFGWMDVSGPWPGANLTIPTPIMLEAAARVEELERERDDLAELSSVKYEKSWRNTAERNRDQYAHLALKHASLEKRLSAYRALAERVTTEMLNRLQTSAFVDAPLADGSAVGDAAAILRELRGLAGEGNR